MQKFRIRVTGMLLLSVLQVIPTTTWAELEPNPDNAAISIILNKNTPLQDEKNPGRNVGVLTYGSQVTLAIPAKVAATLNGKAALSNEELADLLGKIGGRTTSEGTGRARRTTTYQSVAINRSEQYSTINLATSAGTLNLQDLLKSNSVTLQPIQYNVASIATGPAELEITNAASRPLSDAPDQHRGLQAEARCVRCDAEAAAARTRPNTNNTDQLRAVGESLPQVTAPPATTAAPRPTTVARPRVATREGARGRGTVARRETEVAPAPAPRVANDERAQIPVRTSPGAARGGMNVWRPTGRGLFPSRFDPVEIRSPHRESIEEYSNSPAVQKMIAYAMKNSTKSTRQKCYRFVKFALYAGGLLPFNILDGHIPAKGGVADLKAQKWTNLADLDRSLLTNPNKAPVGSVLVYEDISPVRHGKKSLRMGHIEIRTPTGFVSDYRSPVSVAGRSFKVIGVMVPPGVQAE